MQRNEEHYMSVNGDTDPSVCDSGWLNEVKRMAEVTTLVCICNTAQVQIQKIERGVHMLLHLHMLWALAHSQLEGFGGMLPQEYF